MAMAQASHGEAGDFRLAGGSGSSSRSHFACSLCRESFPFDYHGRKPPFCPQLVFMEDVFCMKDPFSLGGTEGGQNRKCLPTVVGGTCANCRRNVCVQCSLFYAMRICGQCARENRSRLPSELQRMVDATGPPQKEMQDIRAAINTSSVDGGRG